MGILSRIMTLILTEQINNKYTSINKITKSDIDNILSDFDIGKNIMKNNNLNEEKLKSFIDEFTIDKVKGTVTYNKNPDIVIDEESFVDLEDNLKSIMNTSTKSIYSKIQLSNYDKHNGTIDINQTKISIDELNKMIRVLNFAFNRG